MKQLGKLYFFCGKMGAGKTTKSKQLAIEKDAVLLSEDEWLSSLYPDEIMSFEDYLKFSAQLKPLVKKHVLTSLTTKMQSSTHTNEYFDKYLESDR